MDIVLVYPTRSSQVRLEYGIGAASLVAHLRTLGFQAECLVLPPRADQEDFAAALRETKPRVVGFTCYDSTFHIVRCLSRIAAVTVPESLQLVGGPTATASPELILQAIPEASVVFTGEAEAALPIVLQAVVGGVDVVDRLGVVPGVAFRGRGGVAVTTGRPRLTRSLPGLPSAILSGTMPVPAAAEAGVMLSRGCFHHCAYCSFAAMNFRTVRSYGARRAVEELNHIAENHPDPSSIGTIPFIDDNFAAVRPQFEHVCGLLGECRFPFSLSCQIRSEAITWRDLRALRDAGFGQVAFGLESSVPRLLGVAKKNYFYSKDGKQDLDARYVESVARNVRDAKELGLRPIVSAMVGLPGEERDDALSLLAFLDGLGLGPAQIAVNVLHVACGTEFYSRRNELALSVATVWEDSIEQVYATAAPAHVAGLPAVPGSIVYIQRRSTLLALKEALQAGAHMESAPGAVFVCSLDELRESLPGLSMNTVIYAVETDERELDELGVAIARYLVATRTPIASLRKLLVHDAHLDCCGHKAPCMGDLSGPLRVYQLDCSNLKDKDLAALRALSPLSLLLVVSSDPAEAGRFHRSVGASLSAVVAYSPFPLSGSAAQGSDTS